MVYSSLRAVMVICTTSEVTLAGYAPALISVPPPLKALSFQLFSALPAMGTWLLLAVTNHITQNIASIPFLWLLPLTLYLLSFIICFDHERWYHRYGCRRWLTARRDVRINEILETGWLGEGGS